MKCEIGSLTNQGYGRFGLASCLSIFRHAMLIELNTDAYQIQAGDSHWPYDSKGYKKLCYGPFPLSGPAHAQQSSSETPLGIS